MFDKYKYWISNIFLFGSDIYVLKYVNCIIRIFQLKLVFTCETVQLVYLQQESSKKNHDANVLKRRELDVKSFLQDELAITSKLDVIEWYVYSDIFNLKLYVRKSTTRVSENCTICSSMLRSFRPPTCGFL